MALRPKTSHRLTTLALLASCATGCASSGSRITTPQPFPQPGNVQRQPVDADNGERIAALLETALELRGTPYRNGGSTAEGFDCSGFTQFVFARNGIRLPREVREQYRLGERIENGRAEPGDLLFFTTTMPGASHVGIVIGPDEFVHAPSSRGVVRVERVSTPYWAQRLVGIRRVRLTESN